MLTSLSHDSRQQEERKRELQKMREEAKAARLAEWDPVRTPLASLAPPIPVYRIPARSRNNASISSVIVTRLEPSR
ncbi:hypothetical protein BOTBODRAFT_36110 [Botryobasidium botryosum FD-172 SS1]|uniref:Uncharacterized protein n=1 Tax=Botryobasidium botryosum (strain FD-172 SS1) TaxID=930990 RepID=A0A067MFD5_BOTB1|nr:hypothetical protein BOTBODRAFT_36110 [Botryobasidium botryosum FD-172 SS1]